MQFGEIIKRSWRITWRYKALWLLGIFAGVSGCQSSSSGNAGSSNTGDGFTGSMGTDPFEALSPSVLTRLVPALIAITVIILLIWLVWALIGAAARGGLVHAVDRIESGQDVSLGDAWRAGFGVFWRVFGLGVLLQLPLVLIGLVMAAAVLGPVAAAVFAGREPGPEMIGSVCGALGIGLPLLLIGQLILGILYLTALRYAVIGGRGVFDAVRAAWQALMARKKDHFLMWVINWGLNLAASLALAIPVIILAVAVIIPSIPLFQQENWGALLGPLAIFVLGAIALGMLYSGIWGVFTSALWTIFFRKLTGLEPPVAMPAPMPAPAGYAPGPQPGAYPPAPPVAGYPSAPPVAEYPPQPPAPPAGE